MQVEEKPLIEIVPWIVFNKPGVKDQVEEMAKKASSTMSFAGDIRNTFGLSLSESTVVAKKFYKK